MAGRAAGYVRAAHAGPCLVITGIVVALAAKATSDVRVLTLLGVGVLAGQFSIGWSNDAFDADRDRAAGRTDKPVAAGLISRRGVILAAGIALATSVALVFAVGVTPGLVNLIMIAPAWAYNAGLKSTPASGAMYVIGFAPIPVLAAAAAGNRAGPWIVAAAATLGLGGHFTNVIADLGDDIATRVRGLPQRVAVRYGPRAVRVIGLALLVAASAMIALPVGHGSIGYVAVAGATALAAIGVATPGRGPFLAALAIAVLDVALFIGLT